MKTRAITGFFFVVVMLASVTLGERTFLIFFMVLSLLCLDEFYRLVKTDDIKPQRIGGILLALSIYLPLAGKLLYNQVSWFILIPVPVAVIICITELYRKGRKPFYSIAFTFFGILMAVIPFCFYTAAAFSEGVYNFHYSLGFLLLLWASDTGAYLSGMKFGKHKLFERHSPKKTWEGFFGGMFLSLVVSFILGTQFKEISFLSWAIISLIIVVGGTFGDLFESMLKRSMEVKDSGSLLPGHGGLLDRFDGLLLASPLVFVYLYWIFSI